jgi:hypothetical protein
MELLEGCIFPKVPALILIAARCEVHLNFKNKHVSAFSEYTVP